MRGKVIYGIIYSIMKAKKNTNLFYLLHLLVGISGMNIFKNRKIVFSKYNLFKTENHNCFSQGL